LVEVVRILNYGELWVNTWKHLADKEIAFGCRLLLLITDLWKRQEYGDTEAHGTIAKTNQIFFELSIELNYRMECILNLERE